jgi:uncharacterized protein (DUF1778 family)
VATPKKHSDLRDRTEFVLEKKQWDRFMTLLDRPARVTPGLRRLFSKPTVFGVR